MAMRSFSLLFGDMAIIGGGMTESQDRHFASSASGRSFFAFATRQIAAELCVYTNGNFTAHSLDVEEEDEA